MLRFHGQDDSENSDSRCVRLPSLFPPFRFALVEGLQREDALYRSSFPSEGSYRFLKRLRLKTIVSMVPRSMMAKSSLPEFCRENDIQHIHFPSAGTQKPLDAREDDTDGPAPSHVLCAEVLMLCINKDRLPLLLHDENGAHVCGLVVALLRKLQYHSADSYIEEFVRFTKYKTLMDDERQFIQRFYSAVTLPENLPSWLWGGERPTKHPTMPLFAAAVSVGLSPEEVDWSDPTYPHHGGPESIASLSLMRAVSSSDIKSSHSTHAQAANATADLLSALGADNDDDNALGDGSDEYPLLRGMAVEEPSSVMRRSRNTQQ